MTGGAGTRSVVGPDRWCSAVVCRRRWGQSSGIVAGTRRKRVHGKRASNQTVVLVRGRGHAREVGLCGLPNSVLIRREVAVLSAIRGASSGRVAYKDAYVGITSDLNDA